MAWEVSASKHLNRQAGTSWRPLLTLAQALSPKKSIFEGSEGQMAWDISKKTFKKLIQFHKLILFFAMLQLICPSTFPGHGIYEVCLSQTL